MVELPKKQQQCLIPRYLLQYLEAVNNLFPDPSDIGSGGGDDFVYYHFTFTKQGNDYVHYTYDEDKLRILSKGKAIIVATMMNSEYESFQLTFYPTDNNGEYSAINFDFNFSDNTVLEYYPLTVDGNVLSTRKTHSDLIPVKLSQLENDEGFVTNVELASTLLDYAELDDIPTKTSDLTNDSGFITSSALTGYATESWVTNQGYSTFSGSYNDLTNKPTIPTTTSQLTNDSGFITNNANNLTNYFDKTTIQSMFYDTTDCIPVPNVNPVEFPTAQTQSLTNLYVESSDTLYTVSGGGSSYSAGTGIDITSNNVISIDSTVVALKSDIPSTANFVDLTSDQNITGIKTLVGAKKLGFKQSSSSDVIGFTAYDNNNYEVGNLQVANRGTGIYVTLGNYSSQTTKSKVGFRIQPNSSTYSFNFVMPYGNYSSFISNGYTTNVDTTIPCAFTDGSLVINADPKGLVNLGALNLGSSVSGTYSGSNWTSLTINGTTKSIPSGGGGGTTVSGTNDGTNWTSITIGSDTYGIPSGGGGGSSLAPQIYNFTSADWTGTNTNGYISNTAMSREGLDLSTLSAGQTIKIDCIFVRPSNNTSYVHQFTLVIPDGTMATESTDTFQIPGTNQTNLQIEAWMQISNNRIGLFWNNSSQTRYISKIKVYPANA